MLSAVFPGLDQQIGRDYPLIFGSGVLLYLLAVALHYVLLSDQASHEAEKREAEARVLARDSELKALKTQVNPHFIFNCLNSISALTTSDSAKAREMCVLLADFLRKTLGLGEKALIPLGEELALTRSYLSVEQIRFGARLKLEEKVEPGVLEYLVPPLLLQPLVENAVRHGISNLTEGGWIRIEIGRGSAERRRLSSLSIKIENNFDPETPSRKGASIGLKNVRQRLDTAYGDRARFDVRTQGDRFVVSLELPAEKSGGESCGDVSGEIGMSAETNKTCRAIIVDDEELARQVIREMLKAHPEVEIAGECANGFEAVRMAGELKPDLLFLDIQMPKLDGFEVLELIGSEVAIVFVTAHDEHALRAFEVHAVDYLLKPFTAERFDAALERAKERIGERLPAPAELSAAMREPGQYAERIVVKDGTRVQIIPVAKLDYAEAQDDYVALASQGKKHLKQQTISSLEAALDPKNFVRIHRSYLVNLERVARLEPYSKDSHVVILNDGARLPVSRSGYARLKAVSRSAGIAVLVN